MIDFTKTSLGIELGSTRIKAVLLDGEHVPVASGDYTWASRLENGYWTYSLDEVWKGLQTCFRRLREDVQNTFGEPLRTVGSMGVSAMMHGYLPFDAADELLTPFRTWQNTSTGPAAERLTALFHFNVPQRWSIAHLYQAMLNREEHVPHIARLHTLASYVHWKLTGKHVAGIGEASGMFPIDSDTMDYDAAMCAAFAPLAAPYPWQLKDLLPKVLLAGEPAGTLTEAGARLLDPDGFLQPGIPLCPPEGDAGTGMTATNAVAARTGNVSAGTSVFSMVVLEHPLRAVYPEIDMVTTPTGKPVAMVHCNNCTSEMNAWVNLFREALELSGAQADMGALFTALYNASLGGDADCGGVTVCNYLAGEPVTGFAAGVPLVLRNPEQPLTLANFARAHLYSALAALSIGMEILRGEDVKIDRLVGHGGLFKTPGVGQRYLAAATQSPVRVMETAGEGGPYGMALLAAFLRERAEGQTLEDYLERTVFASARSVGVEPDEADVAGFRSYIGRYRRMLSVERAAVEM